VDLVVGILGDNGAVVRSTPGTEYHLRRSMESVERGCLEARRDTPLSRRGLRRAQRPSSRLGRCPLMDVTAKSAVSANYHKRTWSAAANLVHPRITQATLRTPERGAGDSGAHATRILTVSAAPMVLRPQFGHPHRYENIK